LHPAANQFGQLLFLMGAWGSGFRLKFSAVIGQDNRIDVVGSQISGVRPALSHRWDVRRLQRTIMELAAQGRINLPALVSHVMPVGDAADAFELLDQHQEQAVQVLLDFREQ